MTPSIATQVRALNENFEINQRAAEFVAVAKFFMRGKGVPIQCAAYAQQDKATDRVVRILRDAIPGSITDSSSSWGSELSPYASVATGFSESLRSISAFDAMLPAMLRVPLKTRLVATSTGASGTVAAEGAPKLIEQLEFGALYLEPQKASAIVVASDELLETSGRNGTTLLQRELQGAVASITNSTFITTITNGISPTGSSSDPRTDVGTLLDSVTTGAASRLFFIVGSTIAKAWAVTDSSGAAFLGATAVGGQVCGVPVLISDAVSAGTIILADAAGIAAAADAIVLSGADQATLDMGGGTSSKFNLWQRNAKALRCERWFGAKRLRDSAVAVVNNVEYTATA